MDRTYFYRIDKEGAIWHDGTQIEDPRFLSMVHRRLQQTPSGFRLQCQGETCVFEVDDVPYVIQNIALHKQDGERERLVQVDLIFAGGYTEILNPSTLWVSDEDVLYCRVKGGTFPARFTRKAYFQLAPFLTEGSAESYFLELKGNRYPLQMSRSHAQSSEVRR